LEATTHSHAVSDVRLSGFSSRAPLSAAWAWLDAQPATPPAEFVPLAGAAGRVLSEALGVRGDPPDQPRSAENGYAVRSADCDGASAYNPLLLRLRAFGAAELSAGSTCLIASGMNLPSGADAVLPFEAAQQVGEQSLEVLAPVAPGTGLVHWPAPSLARVLAPGHCLNPADLGRFAAAGVERVSVVRRPRVALLVPGAKSGPDALTLMLGALLARDEALVRPIPVTGSSEPALSVALARACGDDCDLILVAGRAGAGPDDTAAPAVRATGGTLVLHGIALHPGGASGLGTLPKTAPGQGRVHSVPVVLLPGEPFACLVAYDMLAARFVRRLAGADTDLPYPVAEFELTRKIVSRIGTVEIAPVTLASGKAVPIGAQAGLAGMPRADGFVVVPEASEGYREGGGVRVHLYDRRRPEVAREME